MDKLNRSVRIVPAKTYQLIEAAGSTDFEEEVIEAFLCTCTSDSYEQNAARGFNLALRRNFESLSMMPLTEEQILTLDEVREPFACPRKEIYDLQNHAFCNIHVSTARKQEGSFSIVAKRARIKTTSYLVTYSSLASQNGCRSS
ncbi:methyl transferase [Fusarium globosum]|uniref:Methyl transferase n=1 Tax=Fusarium globosum TaxID=78864 RepID=A0A8H6DAQ2_9HYPO|nr:methyl transferase [Fusarium globosum]